MMIRSPVAGMATLFLLAAASGCAGSPQVNFYMLAVISSDIAHALREEAP